MPQVNVTTVTTTNLNPTGTIKSAGGTRIPNYTTGTRPGSATTGSLIFDTTLNQVLVWDGSSWAPLADSSVLTKWDGSDNRPTANLTVGFPGYNTADTALEIYTGVTDTGDPDWRAIAGSAAAEPGQQEWTTAQTTTFTVPNLCLIHI